MLGIGVLAAMIVPISSPNISMIALDSCGYCNMQGRTNPNCSATASWRPVIMASYCSSPRAVLTQLSSSGDTVSRTIDIGGGVDDCDETGLGAEVGSWASVGAIALTATAGASASFPPPQATAKRMDATIVRTTVSFISLYPVTTCPSPSITTPSPSLSC